jgi:hypothetical protein
MKKIVFITLCLLGFTMAAHAQVTINGLSPGKIYTLAQMKAALGDNPSYESIHQRELGTHYRLGYGDDSFSFGTFLGFTVFTLKTKAYPVVINGRTIRVGDDTSILLGKPELSISRAETWLYHLYIRDLYDPIMISFNKDKVITKISYMMSIY